MYLAFFTKMRVVQAIFRGAQWFFILVLDVKGAHDIGVVFLGVEGLHLLVLIVIHHNALTVLYSSSRNKVVRLLRSCP